MVSLLPVKTSLSLHSFDNARTAMGRRRPTLPHPKPHCISFLVMPESPLSDGSSSNRGRTRMHVVWGIVYSVYKYLRVLLIILALRYLYPRSSPGPPRSCCPVRLIYLRMLRISLILILSCYSVFSPRPSSRNFPLGGRFSIAPYRLYLQ